MDLRIIITISLFFGLTLGQSQNSDIHLPRGRHYGQVVREPYPLALGGDQIFAVFIAGSLAENANKDNNQVVIERLQNDGFLKNLHFLNFRLIANFINCQDAYADNWELIRDDTDADTIITWKKPYPLVDQSRVEVNWEVPTDIQNGLYRMRHLGYYSADNAILTPYIGKTQNFRIRAEP